MGKFGGIALIVAAAISLAACSAPAASAPSTVPAASGSSSASAPAAAIKPHTDTSSKAPAPGTFGDPETDAKFLDGVKEKWRGELPSDSELISAAKFACQEYASGKMYDEMRPVVGDSADDRNNGIRVAVFAGRIYCTKYNPDKL